MKRFLSIFLLLAVITVVSGCAKEAEQDKKVSEGAVQVTVTADELIKLYEDNEVAADAKYKGKIVQVSGIIVKIEKGLGGHPILLLKPEGKSLRRLRCVFAKTQLDGIAKVSKEQTVSLKGLGDGMFATLNFKHCHLIN